MPDTAEQVESPIQSPVFAGFQSESESSDGPPEVLPLRGTIVGGDPDREPNGESNDGPAERDLPPSSDGSDGDGRPDEPDMSLSKSTPGDSSDGPVEPGLPPSNQIMPPDEPEASIPDQPPEISREIISSPKSYTSFDRILDEFIQSGRQDSSGESVNPEASDEHESEEQEIQDDEDIMVDLLSGSPPSHQKPAEITAPYMKAKTEPEASPPNNTQPAASQADVVDLTQESPDESDGGLPNGPGWVPKSPAQGTRSRIQKMKEVSISPSQGKKGSS